MIKKTCLKSMGYIASFSVASHENERAFYHKAPPEMVNLRQVKGKEGPCRQ